MNQSIIIIIVNFDEDWESSFAKLKFWRPSDTALFCWYYFFFGRIVPVRVRHGPASYWRWNNFKKLELRTSRLPVFVLRTCSLLDQIDWWWWWLIIWLDCTKRGLETTYGTKPTWIPSAGLPWQSMCAIRIHHLHRTVDDGNLLPTRQRHDRMSTSTMLRYQVFSGRPAWWIIVTQMN